MPQSLIAIDGKKIRKLRDRAGLTLTQFAAEVHTDFSHLSRIERGVGRPGIKLRDRIAARLGVTVDDLAKDEAEPTPDPSKAA